jgi:hypothetical protein
MSFAQKLEYGKVAEGLIAQWLMARGNSILPVYEIEKSVGKGPQLFSASAEHVAPDMVAFTSNGVMWVEAKHKTVFTWHRNTQHWTTGIDLRHYGDYMHVAKQTKLPVWLMFFHRNEVPSDSDKRYGCPSECPTGLFGGDLFTLILKEHHRTLPIDLGRNGYLGHGKSGMVYWAHGDLQHLATKQEVFDSARSQLKAIK